MDDKGTPDPDLHIPDLTGKVALVTGANSSDGIGFHIAFQMAVKGAKVFIGARNAAKAQDAITEMRSKDPSLREDQLHPFAVDLGDLKAVQAAARDLMATAPRLDILVNNAGLIAKLSDINSHGVSVTFNIKYVSQDAKFNKLNYGLKPNLISHLAHFVLTTELLPLLRKTARTSPGVRVVAVSSVTHKLPPAGIRFDSLASFNAGSDRPENMSNVITHYGVSKLANVLFAKQLQQIFNEDGTEAVALSLYPGGVRTDGSIKFLGKDNAMLEKMISPIQGAITPLFAATSPKVWEEKETYGGAYLVPFGKLEAPSADAQNSELARELWATSELVVKAVLEDQPLKA